jgi:hypothetical protein
LSEEVSFFIISQKQLLHIGNMYLRACSCFVKVLFCHGRVDLGGSQWLFCSGTRLRTRFGNPKQRRHSARVEAVLISFVRARAVSEEMQPRCFRRGCTPGNFAVSMLWLSQTQCILPGISFCQVRNASLPSEKYPCRRRTTCYLYIHVYYSTRLIN